MDRFSDCRFCNFNSCSINQETANARGEDPTAAAFHTYNADKPRGYLEQTKPYMTDALYEKMNRNGRREVLERSYMTVKETEVTPLEFPLHNNPYLAAFFLNERYS
ncbi:hypothetical protein LIT32_25960 (plasmid) [Bacillus sp. CMF21]|nr:hypothetical protein LIT32_25960 [Bacillus sp. CMF21]